MLHNSLPCSMEIDGIRKNGRTGDDQSNNRKSFRGVRRKLATGRIICLPVFRRGNDLVAFVWIAKKTVRRIWLRVFCVYTFLSLFLPSEPSDEKLHDNEIIRLFARLDSFTLLGLYALRSWDQGKDMAVYAAIRSMKNGRGCFNEPLGVNWLITKHLSL